MNTQKKAVYATGDKVFTRIGSGLWSAMLYSNPVMLERVEHDHWKCIDEKTDEILGEGFTRNEAMREGFYSVSLKEGYDKEEAKRLDWILVEQPYRSYGGHKARCKTVNVEGYKNVKKIVRDNDDQLQQQKQAIDYDPVKMLIGNLEQYKTSYNAVLGGWHYYKRDNEGKIDGGIKGPFKTQKEMFKSLFKASV